jgi:hypothetical protein
MIGCETCISLRWEKQDAKITDDKITDDKMVTKLLMTVTLLALALAAGPAAIAQTGNSPGMANPSAERRF